MIVLDTNVISEIFRPNPDERVVTWLGSLTGEVAVTAVTLAELRAGVGRLPEGKRRSALQMRIEAALQPYRETRAILVFDDDAAGHYAEIVVARERAGIPISMADAQIAAMCRSNSATCATRNTKDFTETGIELINPWDE
ncbi:type II toxin-antitoxin system VapC family toxin [Spiractinospora alimapuensis]|uniref:type II toxin-antitoxin system VapC family toxin n=1 Tax=Spiractinospora alimapuensis TaxID=2820884 RepID=UPI001F1CF14E|nr:type II toxin-antitoxin system VapC family toxin [Spiractinospora alimapuensis]QVQ53277.1 type II toxin-antitoxin system VapC family toxin [Spiractinospora alimapuensis]